MFGNKAALIAELETENRDLRMKATFHRIDMTTERMKVSEYLARLSESEASVKQLSAKLALAERAFDSAKRITDKAKAELDEAISGNHALYEEGVKAQTEILELKADIAEQVRVNRSYAEGIGEERRVNDNLRGQLKMHMNSTYGKPRHFFIDTDSVDTTKPEPEPEPETGYGPEYVKLQRKVKRLKAKVAKLTKHNKALSVEVLQSRNGMM